MSLSKSGASRPRSIGPYRLEARLGAGGMGVVYRAYDERLRRRVAIKHVLAREGERAGRPAANLRQRLHREARTAARLHHPAIVRIYDVVEADDGDWVVMELVEGRTLRQVLGAGELDLDAVLSLACEVADGLAVAHDQGIVHRDLKVDNLMVSDSGHAKILDFGLAKNLERTDPSDTTLSGDGVVVGTFHAMSPEQILEQTVDPRSDLFSFGTLLYEMLTGESPFAADNTLKTMSRVCVHRQPPVRALRPEISQELSDLVDRLLEKDPGRRPADAREVIRLLGHAAGRIPGTGETPPLDEPPVAGDDTWRSLAPTASLDGLAVAARLPRGGIAILTLVAGDLAKPGDAAAWTRLEALRRELTVELGGRELDAGVVAFERPVTALELALELHRRAGVPVRCGVHLGEVVLERDPDAALTGATTPPDDPGSPAVVVRRVMELARPGQVLFTAAVSEIVQRGALARRLGAPLTWSENGWHRLAGLDDEVEIFAVTLAGEAPPAASPAPRAWPLPIALGAPAAVVLLLGVLWLRGCW